MIAWIIGVSAVVVYSYEKENELSPETVLLFPIWFIVLPVGILIIIGGVIGALLIKD